MIFYLSFLVLWSHLPSFMQQNLNFKKGAYGHMNTRLKEVENYKKVDILFLGSSHAYRGIDTRIFEQNGYTCFNLGSSAQTPIQSYMLLQRHLEKLDPKFVVMDIYPEILYLDGVESGLDLIANGPFNKDLIQMLMDIQHIKLFNTLIYAHLRAFLFKDDVFVESIKKELDQYISGGYVQRAFTEYDSTLDHLSHKNMNPLQVECLNKIAHLLKDKALSFHLVSSPVTTRKYVSMNYSEMDVLIDSLQIPYYDFNINSPLKDSSYFYDPEHLNPSGVEIYTNQLLDFVRELK